LTIFRGRIYTAEIQVSWPGLARLSRI